MTVADSICDLRELAKKLPRPEYPWEEEPRFSPPAAESQVRALEQAAEFSLPPDVRDFFGEVGDVIAMSIHNGYWIGGIPKLIALSREARIPRTHNEHSVVPVATDGGGNLFFVSEAGAILNWRHDSGEFSEVSTTFGEFLELVVGDWRAYISNTPGWRYLV
jgi:hypothetical protein